MIKQMSLTKQTNTGTIISIKKSFNQTTQLCQTLISTLNKSQRWKNNTNKMLKTMQNNDDHNNNKNVMTEEDIDRLFDKFQYKEKKEKSKLITDVGNGYGHGFGGIGANGGSGFSKKKNYVHGVCFLKMDDTDDKFMTGVDKIYTQQDSIQELFNKYQENKDFTAEFKKNYLVGKIIGEGAYASVRVAIFKPEDRKIALKIYQKSKIKDPQRKKSIRRQITILSILSHESIVKIFDVVQSNNHLNLIMQYLPGTSLGSYLKSQPKGKIVQKQCKKIFQNLAKALKYMHSMNIAHRDIKLENIILDDTLNPKIIDFGFSTCIEKDKKIKIFCGTPSYMAPQVVQRKEYRGEGADVWALGVMLFVCITGIFPFKGSTDQELYKKINSSDYPKGQLIFSRQISDLISKMLKVDPEQRITANQMIKHPWFNNQQSLSKKKNTQSSLQCQRKRINTQNSASSKQKKWAHKTGTIKNMLCQTTDNERLRLQLKMALNSPKMKQQIQSYRLSNCTNYPHGNHNHPQNFHNAHNAHNTHITQNKQNMVRTLKPDKLKNLDKKQKTYKGQSKLIDFLKMDLKKKENDRSKNKKKL